MTVAEILEGLPKLRVLVVGDVCLDRWCQYDPALADDSRETGIPRVAVISTEVTPGAAGTVAANAAALGARVSVLGLIGIDGFGYELKRALEGANIDTRLLMQTAAVSTFTYPKLLNCQTGDEDLPRVDFVNTRPLPDDLDLDLVGLLEKVAPEFEVILVSDQAETQTGGVVTAEMRAALSRIAAAHPEIVIWVDSRMRMELFRGVIVKANRFEATRACERAFSRVDYQELRRLTEAPVLIMTRGAIGAVVVDTFHPHIGANLPTLVKASCVPNPVDICGAGDSFSAGAALALKITGDAIAAARFGNLVASITIMKKGTGTASPHELLNAAVAEEPLVLDGDLFGAVDD
jgi:rfaE bifunctional protein kinase chain/domain